MGSFYKRLSYSLGNEDWRTEKKALQVTPESRVLCITASGDRPLNLLAIPLTSITAIDTNPVQNALFDLKMAALQTFTYEDYLAFLGLAPMKNRLAHFEKLKGSLRPLSLTIWEKHLAKIQKGILFQGTIEKLAKLSSTVALFFRKKKIDKLFSFTSVEEQRNFVKKEFYTPLWMQIFPTIHLFRRFLKDPGLYEYVSKDLHVGNFIYERIDNFFCHFPARESLLMSLLLRGRLDLNFLPPYMDLEHIPQIKTQLGRVHYQTVDLLSHLEQAEEGSYDRFSLSDVASYLPRETFEKMLSLMVRVAKNGSRFCLRQFMTRYEIPENLRPYFRREPELEAQLTHEDNCFVYHFMVGEVVK